MTQAPGSSRPLLVVNPRSNGGKTGRTVEAIAKTVERSLGPVTVALTQHPTHGTDLARDGALAGHPLIIAVGGDGTIHEVVNGLMQARTLDEAKRPELALIGQGTGGDLRRTLGIEHRLDRYVEAIASGKQRALDVARFRGGGKETHYFVNILSAGLGGLVDRYISSASRLFGGQAAYFGASLKALLNARLGNLRCTVTLDGKTEEHRFRSYMVAICNGRFFGGGMNVAPMASLDDGILELVALGATSKLAFAARSGAIYSGGHLRQEGTVHLRAQKVSLTLMNDDAREHFLLDVDGEPMGSLPLEVEIVPRALVLRG